MVYYHHAWFLINKTWRYGSRSLSWKIILALKMSGNHNQLLRRPLPSQKTLVKLPAITQNAKKVLINNAIGNLHQNSNRERNRDDFSIQQSHRITINNKGEKFDIFEDGDKNLLKPLGPDPFYPTYAVK